MNDSRVDSGGPATAGETRAPGRTLGFTVMTLVIAGVAFWMNQQAPRQALTESAGVAPIPELAGFRSDAWFLPDEDLLGFVEIPAGSFIMGSNPGLDRMAYVNERWSNLRLQGSVDLPRYYISRFETTVAQYQAYLADTGRTSPEAIGLIAPGNFPVATVTWSEAIAYTRWLDAKLRESELTPEPVRQFLQDGGRVTLPTEAEWEKAARGEDGRIWPWGSRINDELANFNGNALRSVGAVRCAECAYGLVDMAGNVWELTRSPLQDYPYDPSDDATGLDQDPLFVMRGGGYSDAPANIRTAVRGGVDPGVRNDAIGFRVVISSR